MNKKSLIGLLAATFLSAAGLMQAQAASPSNALDAYLNGLTSLRASFSQSVTDAKGGKVQKARGVLVIRRPGKFRWELTQEGAAFPQLMVADGRNLWFYDRDLEQVSVKPASSTLTATPATLLSGDGKLEEFFKIESLGNRDGLSWVRATPKRADADFREARIAFKGFGTELKQMVLKDKLGQTVTLEFSASERNKPVADSEVTFELPAGADLIGTPVT